MVGLDQSGSQEVLWLIWIYQAGGGGFSDLILLEMSQGAGVKESDPKGRMITGGATEL